MDPVDAPPLQNPAYSPTPLALHPQSHRLIGPGVAPVQDAQSLIPSSSQPFDWRLLAPLICVIVDGPKVWKSCQSESTKIGASEISHVTSIHAVTDEEAPAAA